MKTVALRLDKAARVVVPLSFISLNVAYWHVYG